MMMMMMMIHAFMLLILLVSLMRGVLSKSMGQRSKLESESEFITDKIMKKHIPKESELAILRKMKSLHQNDKHVMFWRLQKVGSSSVLSLLISYGYRYNHVPNRKSGQNSFCKRIKQCNNHGGNRTFPYASHGYEARVSLTHEICNSNAADIHRGLPCAFGLEALRKQQEKEQGIVINKPPIDVDELFLVRDPISRAISCYYFWGEIFKMKHSSKNKKKLRNPDENGNPESEMESRRHRTKDRGDERRLSEVFDDYDEEELDEDEEEVEEEEYDYDYYMEGDEWGHSVVDKAFLELDFNSLSSATTTAGTGAEAEASLSLSSHGDRQLINSDKINLNHNHHYHRRRLILGDNIGTEAKPDRTYSGTFVYHGSETSVPSYETAMQYALRPPYKQGMPGPSFSWSAFASNKEDAIEVIQSDRMMTLVLERMPESLVVASHYLGWSLADVVVTVHRKALSSHPKAKMWPPGPIKQLGEYLKARGEYSVYNASVAKLNERIAALESKGVNVKEEVKNLKILETRIKTVCTDLTYLENYKKMLQEEGYNAHPSRNKLRDVPPQYVEKDHVFSLNKDILGTFDICGNCEAHAMLASVKHGLSKSLSEAPLLPTLRRDHATLLKDDVNFEKCPTIFG